ncbi:uncharacterized protein LOC115774725 [Archocentrus centrarchus]|uniref:uncharacterized protein LOC115774725 n=1 Tax=Archocentrus centrarchus TaxID=63155 RepID=UPI0011EA0227|nr:uncharacterized protein LOC115774725 [Archocentrus centrarchus]
MALLELFLIFVLQFEGISGETQYFYHRPGNDVILPCGKENYPCSIIHWSYHKHQSHTIDVVRKGQVEESSARSSRLSVYSDCSLSIKNITAEDAGQYNCLYERNGLPFTLSEVILNILTVSASPSHTDSQRDGDVTLECSLFRFYDLPPCEQDSIRWVDETGTVLLNSFSNNEDLMKCVSLLTVNHQSGHNKRYTCQFVEENSVKIEAHYPPVLIESSSSTAFIITGALMVVLLLVVIAAVFIKHRRRSKVTEDVQKPSQCIDEPDSNITYAAIDHAKDEASPKEKVRKEEAVTYSAVKTKAESDPSSFYSTVS